jgi:hypothetical protein
MSNKTTVCSNLWCKATFFYTEDDMIEVKDDNIRSSKIDNILNEVNKVPPVVCHKCKSFDSELSGGISWKEKEYDSDPYDDRPHQIRYKVTNFKL